MFDREYETSERPPLVLKAFHAFPRLLIHLRYVSSFGGIEIPIVFEGPPLLNG